MSARDRVSGALTALLVAGCIATPVPDDQPARLVNPDDASREELERAVRESLRLEEVTLAADALTRSSVLLLEQKPIRSLDSPPLSGRDPGTPERFLLVKAGNRCVLVHEGSGRRFALPSSRCVAE